MELAGETWQCRRMEHGMAGHLQTDLTAQFQYTKRTNSGMLNYYYYYYYYYYHHHHHYHYYHHPHSSLHSSLAAVQNSTGLTHQALLTHPSAKIFLSLRHVRSLTVYDYYYYYVAIQLQAWTGP